MFNEGAFDRESAEYLARLAYKKLREKNPDNPLLGFARVMERGFWLWKKEELEVIPELADEFRERYKPRHGAYPLHLKVIIGILREN